jgi:putative transposase
MVRILSVVDAYTRECLALEADTSLGSGARDQSAGAADRRTRKAGEPALGQRPRVHLAAHAGLAEDFKVGLVHIQPGRPMQNGHVESFHGRLRDECLNASWFRTLNDVRSTLAS